MNATATMTSAHKHSQPTATSRMGQRLTVDSPIAPLLFTDGYKVGHRAMYPEGTTRIYSNYTNRASRLAGVDKVVHFGLQAYLQRYLVEAFEPFFAADEDEVANLYQDAMDTYLGPGVVAVDHIRALHRLGYLPLRFCAVPEGTLVPLRVASFTIENTHPEFFWLTNYIESALSASVWHASTTATIALQYRTLLEKAAKDTGASLDAVDFGAHDFSFRGQTSVEAAAASGAGHLLSFLGSDSLPALDWIARYYPSNDQAPNGLVAASVPATEHSVMCAGGMVGERETFERLLEDFPTGILSVVADTWDLWGVLTKTLPSIKDKIMDRDGRLVIRPDSGNPVDIICGSVKRTDHRTGDALAYYGFGEGQTPEQKGVVELLWDVFGGTVNEAGYKELDPHIGAIYGDSITLDRAQQIASRLAAKGFASTNIVLGVGSFTYQYVTRDTFSSAIKATWAEVADENGKPVGRNLLKDPVTDSGMKKSATGRLAVFRDHGDLVLVEKATREQESASLLQPVWENGRALVTQSFAEVRATLAAERNR
jgi:nicotinamide phosphoribosyltransferase